MKKAILTCGLFSMMMILTSFTNTADIGGQSSPRTGNTTPGIFTNPEIGGQSSPRTGNTQPLSYDIGGQSSPRTGGTQPSAPTGIKLTSENIQRSI